MSYFDDYRMTSPFGWRTSPINGKKEFHTGIDLVKKHQEPIYTFVAGKVLFAGHGQAGSGFGGYGNVVAVRDKYGALHCYCHLDSYIVRAGENVERGKMIGRQGTTGQSTGSHLHYEIRKTSSPQYGWIADRANNCFEPSEYLQDYYHKEQQERERERQTNEASSWAKSSQTWVIDNGISDGKRPKDPLTREEMWAMLQKYDNFIIRRGKND